MDSLVDYGEKTEDMLSRYEVYERSLNYSRSTEFAFVKLNGGASKQHFQKIMGDYNLKNDKQEQDNISVNKLECAFEICLPLLVEEVSSVADCCEYLRAKSILEESEVSVIQSSLERKNQLLYYLTNKGKLHTLYEVVDKPGIRDHVNKESVFFGGKERRVQILEDYLLSNLHITNELLDRLVELRILKEQDRCQLTVYGTDDKLSTTSCLFHILRKENNCALFSLLAYLSAHGDIPCLWDKLTDEYRKVDRLEHAFEVCLPLLLEEMCSPLQCADHLVARGFLEDTEKILAEKTRLGGIKQLIYQLLETGNLHALYAVFGQENVKEDHIKDEIDKAQNNLPDVEFYSISTMSPRVRHWKNKTAEMSLFGEESLLTDLREYFCSNVNITDQLLAQIAALGTITETDLRSFRCSKAKSKEPLSESLFYTLLEAKNGSLYSMLSFLHLQKLCPRLWDDLAEKYEETLKDSRGPGNLELKTKLQLQTFKKCYNVERIHSTPGALEEADAMYDELDARLKRIIPGCVTFSLQFKSVQGLLQCWLEYLDGRLSEKLSTWAGKLVAGDMSLTESTPEQVNIEVTQDMFLKTLSTLIHPGQSTREDQRQSEENIMSKTECLLHIAEKELERENLTHETLQALIQRDSLQRCDRLNKEMCKVGAEICHCVEKTLTAETRSDRAAEQDILMKNYRDIRRVYEELKLSRRVLRVDSAVIQICEECEENIVKAVDVIVTNTGYDGVSKLRDLLFEYKDLSRAWIAFLAAGVKKIFEKINLGEEIYNLIENYPKEIKGHVQRWAYLTQRIADLLEIAPGTTPEKTATGDQADMNHADIATLTMLTQDVIKTVKPVARYVHLKPVLESQNFEKRQLPMDDLNWISTGWIGQKMSRLIEFCQKRLNESPREPVSMLQRDLLFSTVEMAVHLKNKLTDQDFVEELDSVTETGMAVRKGYIRKWVGLTQNLAEGIDIMVSNRGTIRMNQRTSGADDGKHQGFSHLTRLGEDLLQSVSFIRDSDRLEQYTCSYRSPLLHRVYLPKIETELSTLIGLCQKTFNETLWDSLNIRKGEILKISAEMASRLKIKFSEADWVRELDSVIRLWEAERTAHMRKWIECTKMLAESIDIMVSKRVLGRHSKEWCKEHLKIQPKYNFSTKWKKTFAKRYPDEFAKRNFSVGSDGADVLKDDDFSHLTRLAEDLIQSVKCIRGSDRREDFSGRRILFSSVHIPLTATLGKRTELELIKLIQLCEKPFDETSWDSLDTIKRKILIASAEMASVIKTALRDADWVSELDGVIGLGDAERIDELGATGHFPPDYEFESYQMPRRRQLRPDVERKGLAEDTIRRSRSMEAFHLAPLSGESDSD